MRIDLRFILLLLCFFLSGFAALLYETAWAREFAFVFGTSEFAVVSVLAAYMGGLAAGAAVAAAMDYTTIELDDEVFTTDKIILPIHACIVRRR